jgi:hypothetical protein
MYSILIVYVLYFDCLYINNQNYMPFCKENPASCAEGSLLYNFHNTPVANIVTLHTIAVAVITGLLAMIMKLNGWGTLLLLLVLLILSANIHHAVGMTTTEGRFLGIDKPGGISIVN